MAASEPMHHKFSKSFKSHKPNHGKSNHKYQRLSLKDQILKDASSLGEIGSIVSAALDAAKHNGFPWNWDAHASSMAKPDTLFGFTKDDIIKSASDQKLPLPTVSVDYNNLTDDSDNRLLRFIILTTLPSVGYGAFEGDMNKVKSIMRIISSIKLTVKNPSEELKELELKYDSMVTDNAPPRLIMKLEKQINELKAKNDNSINKKLMDIFEEFASNSAKTLYHSSSTSASASASSVRESHDDDHDDKSIKKFIMRTIMLNVSHVASPLAIMMMKSEQWIESVKSIGKKTDTRWKNTLGHCASWGSKFTNILWGNWIISETDFSIDHDESSGAKQLEKSYIDLLQMFDDEGLLSRSAKNKEGETIIELFAKRGKRFPNAVQNRILKSIQDSRSDKSIRKELVISYSDYDKSCDSFAKDIIEITNDHPSLFVSHLISLFRTIVQVGTCALIIDVKQSEYVTYRRIIGREAYQKWTNPMYDLVVHYNTNFDPSITFDEAFLKLITNEKVYEVITDKIKAFNFAICMFDNDHLSLSTVQALFDDVYQEICKIDKTVDIKLYNECMQGITTSILSANKYYNELWTLYLPYLIGTDQLIIDSLADEKINKSLPSKELFHEILLKCMDNKLDQFYDSDLDKLTDARRDGLFENLIKSISFANNALILRARTFAIVNEHLESTSKPKAMTSFDDGWEISSKKRNQKIHDSSEPLFDEKSVAIKDINVLTQEFIKKYPSSKIVIDLPTTSNKPITINHKDDEEDDFASFSFVKIPFNSHRQNGQRKYRR